MAKDYKIFSIRLPVDIIEHAEELSRKWKRSRNSVISLLLEECLLAYADRDEHGFVIETRPVPFYGQIAGGTPLLIEDYLGEQIDVPKSLMSGSGPYYALQVKGTSMIEEGILDGAYILVKAQSTADEGQIAVVTLEDEATLKKVYYKGKKIELRAANYQIKPLLIDASKAKLQGVFVSIIRKNPYSPKE